MSFYRPGPYPPSLDDVPPPPPPTDMPPLPRGPPPPANMYRGGDTWRPPDRDSHESQRNEFTFCNNNNAPQYPRNSDQYRPTRSRQYAMRENEQAYSHNHQQPERNHDDHWGKRPRNSNRNQRGSGYRVATADRPLLKLIRGDTPEQMMGMVDDQRVAKRFLPADDVSDSGEERMDESDSELDQVAPSGTGQGSEMFMPYSVVAHDRIEDDKLEPPTKRRALSPDKNKFQDENAIPKWSNPDPYTVLPPIDESQRKRKDVVKIIRKARIVSEKEVAAQSQVVTNDDFISFSGVGEDSPAEGVTEALADGMDSFAHFHNAPTGPRHFSHLQNLHEQAIGDPQSPLALPISPNRTSLVPQTMPRVHAKPDAFTLDIQDYDTAYGSPGVELPNSRKRKRGFGMANGSLVQDWVPTQGTEPTPWLVGTNKPTENAGFRLHKEICDFYEFVRPRKFEQTVREDLLDRLQTAVKRHLPNCNIHCFGSFAAGLYLPNADMDLVIISDEFRNLGQKTACQSSSKMHKLGRYLQEKGVAKMGSLEVIAGAKVPIVKFVDRLTSIKVDVSFENETGLIANKTFSAWKNQYSAMPILVTLIKQFLMMRGLNEVQYGGLGGFSVTCMVTSMLQNMPRVQSGEVAPEQHLGEMLIEFLDLYGHRLDISRTGICMNPPGYFNKNEAQGRRPVFQANKANRLSIMDPNKPDNDVSGGSKNVSLIFDRFSRAHREVLIAMRSESRSSLLDWLLGGDYGVFVRQRNHLRWLYTQRWGNPVEDSVGLRGQIQNNTKGPEMASPVKEDNSRTNSNFFANPMVPGIVVKSSLPKPKANKKPGKKKAEVLKSKPNKKGKGNYQEQHLETASSKVGNKPPQMAPEERRANNLKRSYPGIEGVGRTISKKYRQQLIAQYKEKVPGVTARPFTKIPTGPSNPSMKRHISKGSSLPFVSEQSLAEVAKIACGVSSGNPITID